MDRLGALVRWDPTHETTIAIDGNNRNQARDTRSVERSNLGQFGQDGTRDDGTYRNAA